MTHEQDYAAMKKRISDDGGAFAEEILADLIDQGFTGNELLTKFKSAHRQIRSAVDEILAEAERAASGKTPFSTYEDVFGREGQTR